VDAVREGHEEPLVLAAENSVCTTDLEQAVGYLIFWRCVIRRQHPQVRAVLVGHNTPLSLKFPRPPERVVKGGRRNSRIITGSIYLRVDAVPLTTGYGFELRLRSRNMAGQERQ